MRESDYIAHVKQVDGNWQEPHLLIDHLNSTSQIAQSFAKNEMKSWIKNISMLHDLGKYLPNFQNYIRQSSGYQDNKAQNYPKKVDHARIGAIYAINQFKDLGSLMAYIIAGHHSGLPNWSNANGRGLRDRLADADKDYKTIKQQCPSILNTLEISDKLPIPQALKDSNYAHLWLRMAFSCLVDADFLDTEAYMDPNRSSLRTNNVKIDDLVTAYDNYMQNKMSKASNSIVQQSRSKILQQTLEAANGDPGIYSLNVPTGGGKTLASLGFALKHAQKYGKSRVIYAIPYTSIIEQTASEFRKIFGDDIVLEHHCNVDRDDEDERKKLASENWDAPIIVTTNVQFFESLFASKPSRCRKLHNIQDSVIILDEAQQIPTEFLTPITLVIQGLINYFGVTFLLCTATQPTFNKMQDPQGREIYAGLDNIKEIIKDPIALAQDLKRVSISVENFDHTFSWSEIADKVMAEDCVLCIVNTRNDAATLYNLLPKNDKEHYHLSGLMCAEHRSDVINKIKAHLQARQNGDKTPIRVISTQLIEAGVDLDFEVVFRAIAGVDSIAQAAGRCNREGKMPDLGKVWVFNPEKLPPKGMLSQTAEVTKRLFSVNSNLDVLSPETYKAYFTALYSRANLDKHDIKSKFKLKPSKFQTNIINSYVRELSFKEAAEEFKFIADSGGSIIVPYRQDEVETLISMLSTDNQIVRRKILRKLQRFSINLPKQSLEEFIKQQIVEEKNGILVTLSSYYDPCLGFKNGDVLLSPQSSVL